MMNHPTMRWAIVSAAVLAGLCSVNGSALAAPGEKDADKVFVGYLFGQPRNINFRLYTHLCHAFLVADGEGSVQKRGNVPSRELTGEAHKAGVKVLLSLGGWGWDKQFASIVSKPEAEDRYVKSVMEIVDEFDYDGIDLDWEYPDTEEEVVGFERLTRRFRKELDAIGAEEGAADGRDDGRLVQSRHAQVARQGVPAGDDGLDQRDDLRLHRRLDELRRPSLAALRLVEAAGRKPALDGIDHEVPARRAGPARGPAGGGDSRSTAAASPSPSPMPPRRARRRAGVPGGNYSNLHKLQSEQGWTRKWDDETKNPWLISPDGAGGDRLRRRRIGRAQDRVGHEAGVPRRLLLADRRRPPARRHQSAPGSLAQGVGEGGAEGALSRR